MKRVRDFYIDMEADGRTSHITGGPRRKGGEFTGNLLMRSRNRAVPVVEVEGFYHTSDGALSLDLTIPKKDDRTILVLPFKDKYVIRIITLR
jgi:hypothetical protein